MSESWKKWECPPDMLTVEEKLKSLQLTERQLEEISLAYYEYEMKRSKTQEQKNAWATLVVRKKSKLIKSNLQEGMVADFQAWLQGRSKHNVKYIKEKKLNPISGRLEETERECTPWGNKSLLHLNDVCEWLKLPIMNRDKVAKSISILKMTTPTNIDEAWIYYKYIVRGIAIDGGVLKEQRYYNVFDYIEKRPTKPQKNNVTGDWEEVEDMNFTPYSMNNPSMPKFNQQSYTNNYNHFNYQISMGNVHSIIDENEQFSSLTPDDKLVLLIKAMTEVEDVGCVLPPPMPIGVPVADPTAVPVAKVNMSPYLLGQISGSVSDAIGKSFEKASTKEKENINEVVKVLQTAQKQNMEIFAKTNNVLLHEFGRMHESLEGIKKASIAGNKVTAQHFREFKDNFKVFDKVLERELKPPVKQARRPPVASLLEAVAVEIPRSPVVIPPQGPPPALPPKPPNRLPPLNEPLPPLPVKKAEMEVVINNPENIPSPVVEERVPLQADAEEVEKAPVQPPNEDILVVEHQTIPSNILLPRLKDKYEDANYFFDKAGRLVGNRVAYMFNNIILNEVMVDMLKELGPNDIPGFVKNVNSETTGRVESRIDKFKEAMTEMPVISALAFNVNIERDDLMKDYLENVYKLSREDITGAEKVGSLSRIYSHLTTSKDFRNIVTGMDEELLKEKIDSGFRMAHLASGSNLSKLDENDELVSSMIKKSLGADKVKHAEYVEKAEEENKERLTYGRQGKAILEALNAAREESEQIKQQRDYLGAQVTQMRDLLKNPDGGIADAIKEKLETIGKYQVYTEEQNKELEKLREAAGYTDELQRQKAQLESDLQTLTQRYSEQQQINSQAGEIVQQYEKARTELQARIQQVESQMVQQQQELQGRINQYDEAIRGMEQRASQDAYRINEYEKQVQMLVEERDRVIQDATERIRALEASNMEVTQRLAQAKIEFDAVNGGQAKEQYLEMERKLRSAEEKLNAKDEETKTYISKYEGMLGTAQEKINEYISKLNEAGKTVEGLEKDVREAKTRQAEKERAVDELKKELKKLEEENKFLNPEVIKESSAKQRAIARSKELYDAKQRLEEKLATANQEFEKLKAETEAKNEELKKIAVMELGIRGHEYKIAQLQDLRKQETERYEKKIATLKKQMEGKGNEKAQKLQQQIQEMQKTLENSEKTKRELENMKLEAQKKTGDRTTRLKEYINAIEAKYQRSETIRSTLEKTLSQRREQVNEIEKLSAKFNNALRYMVADNISTGFEKMFAYGDDANTLKKTTTGRALIDSWNALSKFKTQKLKDVETIKSQTSLIRQYEKQISELKQSTVKTIDAFERKLEDIRKAEPRADPEFKEIHKEVITKSYTFGMDYAGEAAKSMQVATSMVQEIEKRGGRGAQLNPQELSNVTMHQQNISAIMVSAINERSSLEAANVKLEEDLELLYQEEAAAQQKGIVSTEQNHQFSLRAASIHRQQTMIQRGMYSIEEHIHSLKTANDFYMNLAKDGPQGTSRKDLEVNTSMYFAKAKASSAEAAKTAALNVVNAYHDAIRTTPNLLYTMPVQQLSDYAAILDILDEKLAQSTSIDSIEIRKQVQNERQTLASIQQLAPAERKRLSERSYQSAYQTQYEIKRTENTRAGMDDQMLDEQNAEDPANYPEDEFAPGYEEYQEMRAEAQKLIGKAASSTLTKEEAMKVEQYVSKHGGVLNKVIGKEYMDILRSRITDTYLKALSDPDKAIFELFQDTKDASVYAARELGNEQLLIRRTMNDLYKIAQENKNDTSEERQAKIIQQLSSRAPELLNKMLVGTVFANRAVNMKAVNEGITEGVMKDMKAYAIEGEKELDKFKKTMEYMASTYEANMADPQKYEEFITNFEREIGGHDFSGTYKYAGDPMSRPMNYFLNRGTIENDKIMNAGKGEIFGVSLDSLQYVTSAIPGDQETYTSQFNGLNAPIENNQYIGLNMAPYVEAINTIGDLSLKAVREKLKSTGQDVTKHMLHNPLPEVKRLIDNTKAYKSMVKNLENIHYASDAKKKANLVKLIRNSSKAILYDTQRALRDVERIAVREKSMKQFNIFEARSAVIYARQAAKLQRRSMAERAIQNIRPGKV